MKSRFWSIYTGATAALVAVAALSLTLFGFALAAYERTRPQHILDAYLSALNAPASADGSGADADGARAASASEGVALTMRDGTVLPATAAALRSAAAALYADASYASDAADAAIAASDDDGALLGEAAAAALIPDGARWSCAAVPGEPSAYAFSCGGREIFTLTLTEAGRDFGYAVPAAGPAELVVDPLDTPAASLLGTYTATLLAPHGASVAVNGAVRAPGETVSAARADVFGSERDEADVYTLTLAAGARVSVTLDGSPLAEGVISRGTGTDEGAVVDLAGGRFRAFAHMRADGAYGAEVDLARAYFDSLTADYTVTVPAHASVAVGGVALTADNCAVTPLASDATDSYAARVNAAAGGLVSYTVRARYGGIAVAVDGVYAGALSDSAAPYKTRAVIITAPSDALVYLNGVWLDPGDATVAVTSGGALKEIEGLDAYTRDAPAVMSYKVSGLYAEPVVTATVGGADAAVTAADGEYAVSPPDNAALREARAGDVTAFLDAYLAYTAGGRIDTDANFAAVIALVLPSSDAAKVLYASKFSFGQNIPYTVTGKKITLRDFRAYGGDCFAVSVDMTIDLKNFRAAQDRITDMRLVFVRQSDKWLLAKFRPGK
jgi:hypothetical protein